MFRFEVSGSYDDVMRRVKDHEKRGFTCVSMRKDVHVHKDFYYKKEKNPRRFFRGTEETVKYTAVMAGENRRRERNVQST